MKKILMGCILKRNSFPHRPIRDIIEIFELKKVYIFEIENQKNNFFLTFNIDEEQINPYIEKVKQKYPSIFRINRKTKFKTFFTIGALEKLPKDFEWKDYTNSLLVTNKDGQLQQFNLNLLTIVDLFK